jgi:hypothetical protein
VERNLPKEYSTYDVGRRMIADESYEDADCHSAEVSGLRAGSEGRNLEFQNVLSGWHIPTVGTFRRISHTHLALLHALLLISYHLLIVERHFDTSNRSTSKFFNLLAVCTIE